MTRNAYEQTQRIKPMGLAGIEACRQLVAERQAKRINCVYMDVFTASAITQVYDKLKDSDKVMLCSFPIARAGEVAVSVIERAKRRAA